MDLLGITCTIFLLLIICVFNECSIGINPIHTPHDYSDTNDHHHGNNNNGRATGDSEENINNRIDNHHNHNNPWTINIKKASVGTTVNERWFDTPVLNSEGPLSRLDNRVRVDEFLRTRAKCDKRIRISNGVTRIRDKGTLVRFACSYGFHMLGAAVAVCMRGQWSDPPPSCVREGCRTMPIPLHGSLRQLYGGGVLVFNCNYGYLLDGERILTCDGQKWNGTAPTCNEIPPITIAPPITTYAPPVQTEPYADIATPSPTEPGEDPESTAGVTNGFSADVSTTSEEPVTTNTDNNETNLTISSTADTYTNLTNSKDADTIEITTQHKIIETSTEIINDADRAPAPPTTLPTLIIETTAVMGPIDVTENVFSSVTLEDLTTQKITVPTDIIIPATINMTMVTTNMTIPPTTPTLRPDTTLPTEVYQTTTLLLDPEIPTVTTTEHEILQTEIPTVIPVVVKLTTTTTAEILVPTTTSNVKILTRKPKPTKTMKPTKSQTIGTKKPTKESYITKRPTKTTLTKTTTGPPESTTEQLLFPEVDTKKPTTITYTDPLTSPPNRPKIPKVTITEGSEVELIPNLEKVEIIPEKLGNMENEVDSNRYDFPHLLIVIGLTLIAFGLVTIVGGVMTYYWRKNKGIARPNQYDLDGRTLSTNDGNEEFLWLDNRDSGL